MNLIRAIAVIGLSGLMTGCAAFNPDLWSWQPTRHSPDQNNVWLQEADVLNGYQTASFAAPRHHGAQTATARMDDTPKMPQRADVAATRQAVTSASDDNILPVASGDPATRTCDHQRASFGGAQERRVAFLIQMDIEQARSVAESTNIDTVTKAQLLSELSREVKALSQKSQTIELFRDGLYALCQAHANGAITRAAYSERFDSLVRIANEGIRTDSANLRTNVEHKNVRPTSISNY